MKFLIFGHDDESLPFFGNEQGIMVGNNEIMIVGGANNKWLERGCIPCSANGVECHVIKMPERGRSSNCGLGERC